MLASVGGIQLPFDAIQPLLEHALPFLVLFERDGWPRFQELQPAIVFVALRPQIRVSHDSDR